MKRTVPQMFLSEKKNQPKMQIKNIFVKIQILSSIHATELVLIWMQFEFGNEEHFRHYSSLV